jgi:ligand-binding sensor domain-containing protein
VLPTLGQTIVFNKVPPPKDKNFGMVTGITQAKNGYMWLATKNGMYSYNGYQMTSYLHSVMSPNTIASNNLESIFADTNGILWIGSLGSGLDQLDPETGSFKHFRHNPADPNSISNDTVTAILRDKQGILWIGTHGGLDRVDAKTGNFVHHRHDSSDNQSISCNQVRSLYEDRQGTIWIGTGSPFPDNGGGPEEGGLNSLNRKNSSFTRYLHDPNNKHSLVDNKVRAIFEDRSGVLWVGTGHNGLHKMDRARGSFERIEYNPRDPKKCTDPLSQKNHQCMNRSVLLPRML